MGIKEDARKALSQLPEWSKWLGGLVTLAGLIAAVIAKPRPVIAAASLVLVIALAGLALNVVRGRRVSAIDGSVVPRYPRGARVAGTVVLVGIAIGLVVSTALRPARDWFRYSFVPKPVFADVVIARFNATNANEKLEVTQRIKDDIDASLARAGLNDVTVEVVDSTVVANERQARELVSRHDARAVIWGWYDDHEIQVRILVPDTTAASTHAVGAIPWGLATSDTMAFRILRETVLPDISFLSLFLVGHLYYQGNEFLKGRAWYEAAMNALPKNIPPPQQAAGHFFRGRAAYMGLQRDTSRADSVLTVAMCSYVKAIELDAQFYPAFVNLGVILAEYDPEMVLEAMVPTEQARGCVSGSNLGALTAADLFSHARRIRPGSAVLRFDEAAFEWKLDGRSRYRLRRGGVEVGDAELEQEFEEIAKVDPSIPGVHQLLGLIRFDQNRLREALRHFRSALRLEPSAEAHLSIGQTLLRMGDEAGAKREFTAALALDSAEFESMLGLARISIRQGELAKAGEYLSRFERETLELDSRIAEAEGGSSLPRVEAVLLRAKIAFMAGQTAVARQVLTNWVSLAIREECDWPGNECGPDAQPSGLGFEMLLLAALARVEGDSAAAERAMSYFDRESRWDVRAEFHKADGPDGLVDEFFLNNSEALAWADLAVRCAGTGRARPAARWAGPGGCLPAKPREQVEALYAVLDEWLALRLIGRSVIGVYGMACPYAYTYSTARGEWIREGAILTHLNAPEKEERRRYRLARFDGRLLIREIERETSHIDYVRMVLVDTGGVRRSLHPNDPALAESDGGYRSLALGEEMVVEFPEFDNTLIREVWLEVEGYYQPHAVRWRRGYLPRL